MTWMSFNAPLPYPAFTFFISAHALSLIREKTRAKKSHNKNISMTKTTGFKVLATPSYLTGRRRKALSAFGDSDLYGILKGIEEFYVPLYCKS